jgi:hypothetical protein
MKKRKASLVVLAVILIPLAFIFYVTVLPWLILGAGSVFLPAVLPNPPKPQITYREFPFTLVYEVNGERKVINDTLICEFDGFKGGVFLDKYREWKGTLASGKDRIVLWSGRNVDGILEYSGEVKSLKIYYDPGPACYYMGDIERGEFEHGFPNAWFLEEKQDGPGADGILDAQTMQERFSIKLIDWSYTPPIKNTFK